MLYFMIKSPATLLSHETVVIMPAWLFTQYHCTFLDKECAYMHMCVCVCMCVNSVRMHACVFHHGLLFVMLFTFMAHFAFIEHSIS